MPELLALNGKKPEYMGSQRETIAANAMDSLSHVPPTSGPTRPPNQPPALWRGITIAPEERCSDYDPGDYHYYPSVEPRMVGGQGGIYGPYTGTWFESIRETDIEHIVARSEAHDSGLCAVDAHTKDEFASDLLNLTLASPSVNRHQKVDKDAAEWRPDLNQCCYANGVIQVRLEFGIAIDRAQADAPATITHHFRVGATITPTAEPYRKRPDPSEDAQLRRDNMRKSVQHHAQRRSAEGCPPHTPTTPTTVPRKRDTGQERHGPAKGRNISTRTGTMTRCNWPDPAQPERQTTSSSRGWLRLREGPASSTRTTSGNATPKATT